MLNALSAPTYRLLARLARSVSTLSNVETVMKRFAIWLIALPLLACETDGPVERAGEELDEAVEDIRAGGETTGNEIDDAIDEVKDDIEDATE
jgi:hypothetical protein